MPQTTIPLLGAYTQRPGIFLSSSVNYDQRFINALFDYLPDQYTQSANAYLIKRPGLELNGTPSAGAIGTGIHRSPRGGNRIVSAYGNTNSTIFYGATSYNDCGTITGLCYYISEGFIQGDYVYFITSTDGTGWFLPDGSAADATPTFTANTNTNTSLTNVSSTTNVWVGQLVTGVDIPANTRITAIVGTTITISNAATGTTVGVTVTFTRLAKIISANFPAAITGPFVCIDGYALIAEGTNRRVYNSNLNTITDWTAQNYFTFDQEADSPVACSKVNNKLLVLGVFSGCFYTNTGNSSGSPFSVIKELTSKIGCNPFSTKTIATVGDSVFWVGGGPGYGLCAWTMEGFKPKKISNSAIDRQLSGGIGAVNALVSATAINGVEYMIISQNATPRECFILNANGACLEGVFLNGSTVVASGGIDNTIGASDSQATYFVSVNGTSGELYKSESTVFQDDSAAFTLTCQTEPKIINGGKGFTVNRVSLLADNQASGTTTLETSKDDYGAFVTKGTFDMTATKKEIRRGGFYRNSCAFRLTHSANTAWRGQALVVDWEPAVT